MTLDQVTRADFSAAIGQQFTIGYQGTVMAAELTAVTLLADAHKPVKSSRESFSLLFHAPRSCRFLQGICRVLHPELGELDIFLVALGPDGRGMRLEAIFNYI